MKIIYIICALLISSYAFANDKEIILRKDMTYDGEPEKIVYKIWAKSWEGPISWSFEIFEGDHLIFQHKKEKFLDKHFLEYFDKHDCNNLAECHEKWFSHQMLPMMFDEVKVC